MQPKFSIFIVNPITGDFETPESWAKVIDPTTAELIVLKRNDAWEGLFISKNLITDGRNVLEVNFDNAVKLASEYKTTTVYPVDYDIESGFRLPTRRECLDMYDARFQGLDDALLLIGGYPLTDDCIWTGDEDPAPEDYSDAAFAFYGNYGSISNIYKYGTNVVRPVKTIKL